MISMLITTNGRADLMRRSLARMYDEDVSRPDEIVVVDDGTDDNSVRALCSEFRRWTPAVPLLYVRNENPGMTNCCHARNVGLKACRHEDVLTIEPEIWFVTDVVAQFRAAREEYPGKILAASKCYHAPDTTASLKLEACDDVPAWPYINMWKKDWLMDIGGWDESLPGPWAWDDLCVFERLGQWGYSQYLVPGVEIHHMWHPSRIEPAVENEHHVKSKIFPRDIVANQGREWGVART